MDIADSITPFECFQPNKFPLKTEDPKTERQTDTLTEKERILYLSGKWQMPGSQFKLESALVVGANGSLEGIIKWHNIRTGNLPPTFCANEFVQGQIDQYQVEIKGYQADAGLVPDYYEIVLCGSDISGFFGGRSKAFGDWDGRLEGSYLFSSVEQA